ncbi:MAG: hypothetical protein HDS72_04585 [Bacteroidales bacterium]|nr:hypothetical protein [Bacteroidales bacterium]
MKKILTHWAYLNYDLAEAVDYTSLFSEQLEQGWEIESISTAVDSYNGMRIIVVTALLEK